MREKSGGSAAEENKGVSALSSAARDILPGREERSPHRPAKIFPKRVFSSGVS
jgi:hypothetical protein